MKPVRIQMRLYPNRPNDAVVLEWIDSLPVTETGRRQVKEEIVTLIADTLRSRGTRKRPRAANGVDKAPTPKRKNTARKKPEREEQATNRAKSNGANRPRVDKQPEQLPEFPAVDSIGF